MTHAPAPSVLETTLCDLPSPDREAVRLRRLLWGLVAGLVLLCGPLFLCQHLTSDAVLYDLQAQTVLEGGVMYRDIVEPNFPGAVWMHLAVRSAFGWSSVALRAVDLAILFGIIVGLIAVSRTKQEGLFAPASATLCLAVLLLYFSRSEWCHTQRDAWMLLPSLAALALRALCVRRLHQQQNGEKTSPLWGLGLLEGVLWGTAFWMKPHVALPALAVIAASVWLAGMRSRIWLSLLAVLLGGMLTGLAGSAWLIQTGAWPHFWEMQLEWNPEYLSAGRRKLTWSRMNSLWEGFAPWGWLHVAALAVIATRFTRWIRTRDWNTTSGIEFDRFMLLAAMYLGWIAQIVLLQHPFAYVHLPGIMLALAVVASCRFSAESRQVGRMALCGFAVIAILASPTFRPARLLAWGDCLTQGSTLDVRSRVQVETQPNWKELQPVLEFLKQQGLQEGELTAYSGGLVHLYPEMQLHPPTRFVYLDVLVRLFRSRTDEIHQALENSSQRFVVSSLREAGLSDERIQGPTEPDTQLPKGLPQECLREFPFTQPVVFRSGQYLVHRVSEPIGELCTEYVPLEQVARSGARAAPVPSTLSSSSQTASR